MMRAMSEALGARCDLHQRTVPRADGDVKMRTPMREATIMNKTRRTFTVVAAGYLK